MIVQELINYIEEDLKKNNIKEDDCVYINVDYMHKKLKFIKQIDDKIILRTTFIHNKEFLSIKQLLKELYEVDKNLNIWIKISAMFKPAKYFRINNNEINISYDINEWIDPDEVIISRTNDLIDILNDENENKNENENEID